MVAPKNTLLPLLGLLLALFFLPVLAVTARGDACGTYACGSATWTWLDAYTIRDISESVKDDNCDSKYAYIYLQYRYSVAGLPLASNELNFENHSGCHGGYKVKNTATDTFNHPIQSVRVFVCRSDFGPDTCYHSGSYTNPYA